MSPLRGTTLACRLTLHHWVTRVEGDARWQECGRCGKYRRVVAAQNRYPPGGTGGGSGGM